MNAPNSFIFQAVVRLIFFLINIFAVYLLQRGHNWPGGGFIAGLATAISLILLSLGIGLKSLHRIMKIDPARIAFTGLTIAVLIGVAPVLFGHAFLEHFSVHFQSPILGEVHIGTALLFDSGVYLVVVGIAAKIIFVLAKSTQGLGGLVREEQRRYSSVRERPIEEDAPDEQMEPESRERKQ
ncbi:MAG: Na(+)/H(+) antiporter subunit B [Verrucomicrobia bacterium]|nr:Na(+)/H(+) antiporter subunit B [Verrucomicrobiota bacterium]